MVLCSKTSELGAAAQAHESILVVDDQPMSIKLIRSILEGEGYYVQVAANATEALQAVQASKHRPDLDGHPSAQLGRLGADEAA